MTHELSDADRARIIGAAQRAVGSWEYASSNKLAFRQGATYATKYERARIAELEAAAEKLVAGIREANELIQALKDTIEGVNQEADRRN